MRRCGYIRDSPDSCGSTPLMDAFRSGYITVAEILIHEHQVHHIKVTKCPV